MKGLGEVPFNSSHKYKKPNPDRLRAEKRNFLKEFSLKYGYNGKIDQIREEEYPHLRNETYLDHTGATTFTKSAINNFNEDILNNLYGNPHSNSPSSFASSVRIEGVRKRILKHFGTNEDDYNVIFTQNATAAIKMAGEMFPWTRKSTYKYLRESHNSINGLRRFLEAISPDNISSVTENDVEELICNPPSDDHVSQNEVVYNLFAYPAQCNYSGMRFPLEWVGKIKRMSTKKSKVLVLLDAAAYVPSSGLSLADAEDSPDFVCLSFYKMFGFPTGLGALLVKTELSPILRKGFFGGGTLKSVVHDMRWQEFADELPTRYEDGTVNFLNIIALDHAFDSFERIYGSIKNVSNHVTSLNTFLSRNMKSFRHWNGQPVCFVNSDRDYSNSKRQGGIFSFNVRDSNGDYIGYLEMEKIASTYGIHIRAGGNCNPGSVSRWNHISSKEVIRNFGEGKYCSDDKDVYRGKLYGAIRLSIGAMTTVEDILIWLDFFKRHYVEIMPGKTIHDLISAKLQKSKKHKLMSMISGRHESSISTLHESSLSTLHEGALTLHESALLDDDQDDDQKTPPRQSIYYHQDDQKTSPRQNTYYHQDDQKISHRKSAYHQDDQKIIYRQTTYNEKTFNRQNRQSTLQRASILNLKAILTRSPIVST